MHPGEKSPEGGVELTSHRSRCYHGFVRAALLVYVVGVLIGLWRVDGTWPTKAGLALLWPLGAVAFLITLTLLFGASLVAFPTFGVVVAALAALVWWFAG